MASACCSAYTIPPFFREGYRRLRSIRRGHLPPSQPPLTDIKYPNGAEPGLRLGSTRFIPSWEESFPPWPLMIACEPLASFCPEIRFGGVLLACHFRPFHDDQHFPCRSCERAGGRRTRPPAQHYIGLDPMLGSKRFVGGNGRCLTEFLLSRF